MKLYSEEFDAEYDTETNKWLESVCSDPYCNYCKNRPPTPINPKIWQDEKAFEEEVNRIKNEVI